MVKLIVFTTLILTSQIFAQIFAQSLEQSGQIVVLEAPIFAVPDQNSQVVQYARKGQIIYIHPAEFSRDKYENNLHLSYSNEEIQKYKTVYHENFSDKLFTQDEVYTPDPESQFYKTVGKSGADAYILKEHIHLLYKDAREFEQKIAKQDPTDYRIDDPLPPGYPIAQETGYRGQILFSLGTPATSNYPYQESIVDTGFDYNKELIFVWSKQMEKDLTRRLFYGGTFYLHGAYSKHATENYETAETNFKMGVGPYISYDVWRSQKYALNLYGAAVFNFYDNMRITQRNTAVNETDNVEYKAMHLGGRMGSQVFIRNILSAFDLVIGANINLEMPYQYEAYTKPENSSSIWKKTYTRDWTVQQSYFIGMQSDY